MMRFNLCTASWQSANDVYSATGARQTMPAGRERTGPVELPVLALSPPAGQPRRAPEMPAVQIEAASAAGSIVRVRVVAPEGEIRAPLAQAVRDRADGVRQVKADEDASRMCRL